MSPIVTLNATVATIPVDPPPPPSGDAAFTVYSNFKGDPTQVAYVGGAVTPGETIDVLEHQGMCLYVDGISGFTTNNAYELDIVFDFGERYDFQHHATGELLAAQKFYMGTEAGLYPGFSAAHVFRGTNMAGVPQLGPGTPTITQTVTCSVSDGTTTVTLTFYVRVIEMTAYFADTTASTYNTTGLESSRQGTIYVSLDGDFTGAPAAGGTIYHHTLPANAEWTLSTFQNDQRGTEPDGSPENPNYPFSSFEGVAILFKAGETFKQAARISGFPNAFVLGSWGSGKATIDSSLLHRWGEGFEIVKVNGKSARRTTFFGLDYFLSDYDPSAETSREWWNILPYTGKTGTFTKGEIITNNAGAYAKFIVDTGSALLVQQIVDSADTNASTVSLTTFTNGNTLSGASASCTFNATGARQDRTQKWPSSFYRAEVRNTTFDGCSFRGGDVVFGALGPGSVISDCEVTKWYNYAVYIADGGTDIIWFGMSGNVIAQPAGYFSEPLDIANTGATTNWNADQVGIAPGAVNVVIENRPRHTNRCPKPGIESFHKNGFHGYGGWSSRHQQQFRMSTSSNGTDENMYINMCGNSFAGGANQIGWGSFDPTAIPATPKGILMDSNHLLNTAAFSANEMMDVRHNSFMIRNNVFSTPAGTVLLENYLSHLNMIGVETTDTFSGAADIGFRPIIVENNLLEFAADGFDDGAGNLDPVLAQETTWRGIENGVVYRNNVALIDTTKVGTIDATWSAINEDPADFDANLRPLSTADAYQSATGTIPKFDATRMVRPTNGTASRGPFEPAG